MPCSDSSSSIAIRLDHKERFVKFDFAKITCGREIGGGTGYSAYCAGKTLEEILDTRYIQAVQDLGIVDEEKQFTLFLEWDTLRSAIAQYLGKDHEDIDKERCKISSIAYDAEGIEIVEVVFPPKELPKILPCNLAQNN